ncbi:MAG: GtrA family protein [Methanomassiliicoccaceae archaeon]|nr:GtrA family protein [Methanomassiliicoccaceae archaeon]
MDVKKVTADHREALLYVFFGAFTVLVSWVSYAVFVWFDINLSVSNILSWVCAVFFAFVVNKWFVFRARSTKKKVVAKEFGSFFGARIFTGIIAALLFPVLLTVGMDGSLFGVDGFPARMLTSLVEIMLNWIFSKYFIFVNKTKAERSE